MTALGGAPALGAKTLRQQRAALRREIERDHRRKAKAKLRELREQLRSARLARVGALAEAKSRCRAERIAVRDRTRSERLRLMEELRKALHAERQAARDSCAVSREQAKKTTSEVIHRAQSDLEAERKYQEDLKRIERGNRERHVATRASAKERRAESDDEVRANIPPELVMLFERVKRGIKGSPRETRTEAFLRYAEENPEEVLVAIEDKSEALIRDLERKERDAARYVRRRRYTDAELADVPF